MFGHEFFPGWIRGFDQRDLLRACPVLEFLLSGDGVIHILVAHEVDEAIDLVTSGKAARCLFAVLKHAFAEVVGEADVEDVGAVGEDVDPEVVFTSWHRAFRL